MHCKALFRYLFAALIVALFLQAPAFAAGLLDVIQGANTPAPAQCGAAFGGATCNIPGPANQSDTSRANLGAGNPINIINYR